MAPVTIKANARAWYDAATGSAESTHWVAPPLVDDGTNLYAFLQDTGGSPRLRCYKADNRLNPASWTEQDSSNAPTVTNATFPFCVKQHGTGVDVFVFTAATTVTHYTFNLSSDVWASGFGDASTGASPKRNLRCARRSDNDLLLFYSSSADPADIGWARYEGVSWTNAATGILSLTSAEGSHVWDAVMDSTDRCIVVYSNATDDDLEYRTVNSANTIATAVDIDIAIGNNDQQYLAGGRFSMFDVSGTDTIIAPYGSSSPTLFSRNISGESDANSSNLSAEVTLDGTGGASTFRSPIHTCRQNGTDYAAYFDDPGTGAVMYSTRTAGTGAWSGRTSFVTGIGAINTASVVDLIPVSTLGVAVVYQDSSNNVIFDFIVPAVVGATGTVSSGTLSVIGQAVSGVAGGVGSVAGGTLAVAGQAVAATASAPGAVATGSHVVSGQAVAGRSGTVGAIATASLSVSGQAITSPADIVGAVASGSFSVTGQAIAGVGGSLGTVATGAHTVAGQAIAASTGSVATLATGSHAVSGQAVQGVGGSIGAVATGSHTVAGQAVSGTPTSVGAVATGSHVVSGQAVAGVAGSVGQVGTGSHAVTGQAVSGLAGALGQLATGTHAVAGQAVGATAGSVGNVGSGSLAVDGQAITGEDTGGEGGSGTIATGSLAVSGQSVDGASGALGTLTTGSLAVTGQLVSGVAGTTGNVGTGTVSIDGQTVNGIAGAVGAVTTGDLSVAGGTVDARAGTTAAITTGSLEVTGQPIDATAGLADQETGTIASGTLFVSGQAVGGIASTLALILSGNYFVEGQEFTTDDGVAPAPTPIHMINARALRGGPRVVLFPPGYPGRRRRW